jgi:Cd2+/Zn2+-exporting ATPase
MLTGDNEATASEVASELGGIHYIPHLLPEEKISRFNDLKTSHKKMYIGDGINDAPLIKSSDIGIAMGGGSQMALDVADVIIMNDDLTLVNTAFKLSKKTRRIVYQNIILSLGVKFAFLILAGFGEVSMFEAIFADVGITLIAVLNALRLIYKRKGMTHEKKQGTQ